ncbi:phosphomannomutase/phosphoglucomutase [Candidatus Uhrbacteria bacterium]|nr:phosphomannomutase/phosphoglucomutase [Candidatus Uhrbacteria bacterium]
MNQSISSVFKAYDIRGLSPDEIDVHFSLRLGKILAKRFQPTRVLVGRDMRITSAELEDALIKGLCSAGVEVVRIGLCSTPLFNISIHLAHGHYDFGVMVTASHNPGKYNGFKITMGDGRPVGQGSGMEEIRDAFLDESQSFVDAMTLGSVLDDSEALERYVTHVISLVDLPHDMPKMKVAIDIGNGMAGAVLPELLKRLPWLDAKLLYSNPDGNFPHHEANPLKEETLKDLQALTIAEQCQLGVAFDGDADRIGFVDENGEPLKGDVITAFLAQELLREYPGSTIHADVRSSWIVRETVEASGGQFSMCRVGHAMIKQLMRQTNAVFSGELSMHFYYKALGNFESGDYTFLLLLRRLANEGKSLSQLTEKLRIYAKSPEINFHVKDPQQKIQDLKNIYAEKASSTIELDGLRCEFRDIQDSSQDWWFSVRASNTEPLLRLNLEARSKMVLDTHLIELQKLISL